jgi:RNA polymerase sigma factor (sigma-70 family)
MRAEPRKIRITEFFKSEYHKLLNYVHRFIEDTADRNAEDIIQDVMINLFSKSDITIPIENLSAYIYKSLKNRVIDHLRKRNKTGTLDINLMDMEEYSLTHWLQNKEEHPGFALERQELYEKLFTFINSLNEKERTVLIATEMDERTFQSLSREWGIPVGTLLARKSRAIKKIKHRFNATANIKIGGLNGT